MQDLAHLTFEGEISLFQLSKSHCRLRAILLIGAFTSTMFGASQYQQHNLVSDIPGAADQTDPNLVNPWGIAMSPTSPFWISNNHTGTATVYDGQGNPAPSAAPLVVTIPAAPNSQTPGAP